MRSHCIGIGVSQFLLEKINRNIKIKKLWPSLKSMSCTII